MVVRFGGAKGRGQTPATRLARWYITRSGTGRTPTRNDVERCKSIIRRCGNAENAKVILEHHLSDGWRWKNRKSLRYVLSMLDEYKKFLGLSAGTYVMIPKPRCVEVRRVAAT